MKVSVVVPTFNEEKIIVGCLEAARAAGADELLVSDGESTDRTVPLARRLATVVRAPHGRARQENLGAREATGDWVLFCHADVHLAPGAIEELRRRASEDSGLVAGAFPLSFPPPFTTLANVLNRIARWSEAYGGHRCPFFRRSSFLRLGGFRDDILEESVDMTQRIRSCGHVRMLSTVVEASPRRFEALGVLPVLWYFATCGLESAVGGRSTRGEATFYPAVR